MLELKHEPFFHACQAPVCNFFGPEKPLMLCTVITLWRRKNTVKSSTYKRFEFVVMSWKNTHGFLAKIARARARPRGALPASKPFQKPLPAEKKTTTNLLLLLYILYYYLLYITLSRSRPPRAFASQRPFLYNYIRLLHPNITLTPTMTHRHTSLTL